MTYTLPGRTDNLFQDALRKKEGYVTENIPKQNMSVPVQNMSYSKLPAKQAPVPVPLGLSTKIGVPGVGTTPINPFVPGVGFSAERAKQINAPVKDTNAILKTDKADPHVKQLQEHFDFLKQKGKLELNQKQSDYIKRYKTKYPDYSNVPDVNLYAKIIQKHPEAMDKYGNIGDKGFLQNLVETPFNFAKSGAETVQRYADRYSEDVAKGGGGAFDTLAAIGGTAGGVAMDVLGNTANIVSPLMKEKNSRYATTFTEGLSQDVSDAIPESVKTTVADLSKKYPTVAEYVEKGLDIANLIPFLGPLSKAKSASQVDDIIKNIKTSTSRTVVPGDILPGLKTAGRNIKTSFTPDILSKDVSTLRTERLRQGLETQNNNLKTVGNSFAKNTKTYNEGGISETITPIDTFEKYGITPEIDEKTIRMGDFRNTREGGLGKIQDNVEFIGDEIDSTLTATGKKLNTDEYRDMAIAAAKKDPDLRQAGKVQATISKINDRFDDYKQSYGDEIDIFEVNNIRKTANKDWNPDTTDVSSIVGDVGRDIVYNATDDMKIKNLLREQGNLLAARKYAQALNGTKVKGGRLGDYFAGGAGAVAGAIAGSALPVPFLGPAIGAGVGQQIGTKLSKLFSASQFKSPMAELKGLFKSEGAGLPKGKVKPQIEASIESRLLKAKRTPKASGNLPSSTSEVSSTQKLLPMPKGPQLKSDKGVSLSQLPKGKEKSAGNKVNAPIIQKTEVKAKLPQKKVSTPEPIKDTLGGKKVPKTPTPKEGGVKIPGFNNPEGVIPIKNDGIIVGGIDAAPFRGSEDTLYIGRIMIAKEYQGKGLGAKAIHDLFEQKPKFTKIQGHATAESRNFWEKVGAEFNNKDSTGFNLDKGDFMKYFDKSKNTPKPLPLSSKQAVKYSKADKLVSQNAIGNELEKRGYRIYKKGSNLSSSKYIEVVNPDIEDGKIFKIRISDHDLPPTYKRDMGEADWEISPKERYDSHGKNSEGLFDRLEIEIGKPKMPEKYVTDTYGDNWNKKTKEKLVDMLLNKFSGNKRTSIGKTETKNAFMIMNDGYFEISNISPEVLDWFKNNAQFSKTGADYTPGFTLQNGNLLGGLQYLKKGFYHK